MNRWWAAVPLAVAAAVPLLTAPSAAIGAIEGVAVLLGMLGIAAAVTGPVTASCVVASIGYTLALWSRSTGLDVIGAGIFGLALLFLLDLSEFARRFRGAAIGNGVLRGQRGYWLERTALVSGIVMALALAAFSVSLLVPGNGRAVVAGLGVLAAFAGTLYGASWLTRTRS